MHNSVHHASVSAQMPPYGPPLRRTALALLLASCFGAAQANPALPQVVHGQATFNQQGNIFSITNTPNTIINWQSFSIHAGEITRFIQQNGNSAVLNRITGQDPSKILGSLESNGKVFLINPNGIVFGQGAKVDVNGLVASSLGMTNADFLAGKREFTAGGVAGGVSNAGVINAGKGGQVLLIAPNVENTGIITAPNGEVILAAGRSVQLADPGNPQLRVLVSAPGDQALNLGQIIAQGGGIGMAGALVSQRGVLNANSAIVGDNGKIVLKASGQTVLSAGSVTSATGAAGKGGEIQVLGDQVGLFGNAKIDASGATGGGTVLLGGDYQGRNGAVQNARQVLVNQDASIAADAIDSGKGGKVIVWGDESARMFGSISARGGALGGDGGFVETSGHYLAVDGARVDTRARAASGKMGDWLLDPYNIAIVATPSAGATLTQVDQFSDAPTAADSTTEIAAGLISAATSNVTLQALHRIDFNSAINMSNAGIGLTAQAGEQINVNAAITTNGGNVRLSANDNGGSSAGGQTAGVTVGAGISTGNGNLTVSGASITGAGNMHVGSGNLALQVNYQGGEIRLNGGNGQLQGSGALNQTVLLQADSISFNGGLDFGGTAGNAAVTIKPLVAWRAIDLGSKTANALSLSSAELAGISAASLTIGDGSNTGGLLISNALSTAGDLHLNSGSAIAATGAVTVGGAFVLDGGNWVQNAASLPGLRAGSFAIGSGASFLRAAGGDGSTASPYLLADIYGLQGAGSLGLGNSYRLAGNIDASGTVNWNGGKGFVPIAGGGAAYSGIFDGAGFAISNLMIDGGTYDSPVGLFGTLQDGTLRNLSLHGGSVSGVANVGALVGNVLSGTIDNVSSSAAVSGRRNVGGLVGSNGGTISAANASGTVTGLNADDAGGVGGLVGLNGAGASITASTASGAVTSARAMVGGLVGNNDGTVAQSYATGSVRGAANIGGLVGRNGGTISNAYATGAVGAADGSDPAITHENVGGLIGWSVAGSSASNVFSSGAVAGNGFASGTAGGLVGRADAGAVVSNAFFNYETAGTVMEQGGATARTTAQMQQQGSFNGFDFGSTWRIYEGYTTPMLKALLKPLQVNVSGNASGKVYDGQLAAFLGSIGYVGLLDGDTGVNGSLGYGSARNVGNYNLTGLWSTKYDIALGGTTTFAITPRVLTVGIGGSGKVYDGTLGYDGVSFLLDNVVAGDSITVNGLAAFLDRNAGSNKAVHASDLALVGNDLGNYSLAATTADGTAAITARTLNISLSGINKTYDGTTGAQVNFGDDRVSGDALTVAGSAAFGDKNAGGGKTVNVTGVALGGADAGNYVLSANSGSTTADIAARTLNISLNGVSKTYDGSVAAGVTFGDDRVQGDALTLTGNAVFANKNAGVDKTVNVTNVALDGADAGNYVLNAHGGSTTADIAARTLNVNFSGVGKTYDGSVAADVNIGDNRVQGDALTVTGSAAFGDKNAGTGKTVNVTNVVLSGVDAGNYVLDMRGGSTTADISARLLNYGVSGALSRVYDGTTDAALTGYFEGLVSGDQVSMAGLQGSFRDKNAGSGKVVDYQVSTGHLTGQDAGNYVLNANAGSTTADIAARTLNVSFGGVNKTYDGTVAAGVHIGDDRIGGDALTVTGTAAFGDKNAGAGKNVSVTNVALGGQDAGNYVLGSNSGSTTADIAARTLNVSFGGVNKTYDGTVVAGVHFGDDRVQGDALTVTGTAAFGDKNAGAGKNVSVTNVALDGQDAGNYVLVGNSGSTTADIAARTLNVSFGGVNKTYDGTLAAGVHIGDDRIGGDALTVTGSAAFGDKNAGSGKSVNVTNVALGGQDAGNYVLVSNSGSTTADIAARTLNVSFGGVNKTYDGTVAAGVHIGDDRIGGDALTVTGTAAFGDKNAGSGKSVNVTNVALGGQDAGNYVLGSNSGSTTADIAARTLNVSFGGVNKTYDGTLAAGVHIGDDRIGGDALTVTGTAAFGDKNAGAGKSVSVTNVALGGQDAGNYVLGSNSGSTTADIAARTLNVSFGGVNKTYDGTVAAGVHIGDDRIGGDALTVTGTAAFGDKNAGVGKSVSVTNVALDGQDAGNYVLNANTGSTTADIAARTLNVSFGGVNKTYDGTVAAGVHIGDDRIGGDALTLTGTAAFGDKNAGNGKSVSVTNVALGGQDAGNYVLGSNSGSTTADIAARALNLSGVAGNKVYDGTTGATVTLGDDRLAGDSISVLAAASFADKNVGAGKAVTLYGAELAGSDAGNYFVVLPTGLLASITPASLTLSGLSAGNKIYDGSTSATVSATANGVLGQDVVSVVGGSGSFADKNAGTGKLVTASGFRLAGADAGNYTLETTGGTAQANIAQKQLSTWIGSGNGLWSDAANWDGGVVPEGANVVAVDFSNSSGIVTYSAAAGNTILKNLNSASGLLLTGGSLSLGDSVLDRSLLASLEINGGSLLLNGSLSADRYAQGGGMLSGSGNLLVANSFSQLAGAIRLAGQLAITQAAGDLRFASLAASDVQLTARNGAIGQDGALAAGSLNAQARNGIVLGNSGNQVGSFNASNSAGGGIVLNNTSAPGQLTLGTLVTGAGNIAIDNTGGIVAGDINANGGNVALTAHSPVKVSGKLQGNDIALNASTDVLLGEGAQLLAARDVSLVAGGDIVLSGNAKVVSGGNVSASAERDVRFADTASVALPAAASMSVLAKTGSITGAAGVRINRQRSGVTLLAPNGAVSMADAIFLPAATIDKPVIDAATSLAISDALRIIKQADRANDPLVSTPPATPDDKKNDSKDIADATDKPTGYKFDDAAKKMYCN